MIRLPHKSFKMAQYGSGNRAGTFILGSAFAWHGGIHLETDEDLVAIADGRLVAYRVAENYIEEEIEGVGKTRYSNCFALLQHEMDADGTKLTYYCLYNHLFPASEMKDKFVSELFQKCTWEVEGEDEEGVYGIWGYWEGLFPSVLPRFTDPLLVSFDTSMEVLDEVVVEMPAKVPRIPVSVTFYKVRRLPGPGTSVDGPLFFVKKEEVEIIGETVDTSNPSLVLQPEMHAVVKPLKKKTLKDYEFDKRGNKKGLRQYTKAGDVNDVAAIIGVIAKGTEITVSGRPVMGKWHKVLDQGDGKEGGYLLLSGKEEFTVSPTFTSNDVVGCDLPVKAGSLIGKAGDFGHEIDGKYKDSCHFEIFTADDVEAFLNNASDDRLDYLKLTASNEFSSEFEIKTLPKGYPVEVLEKRGNYSKVKIPMLTKTVPYAYLGIFSKEASGEASSYALKGETDQSFESRKASTDIVATKAQDLPQANLVELKKLFGDFLTADDRLRIKSKNGNEREVYFHHPMAGKTVWIRTAWTEEPMALASPLGMDGVQVSSSTGQPVQPPLANIIID